MRTLVSADRLVTASGRSGDAVLVDDGHVVATGNRSDLAAQGVEETRYEGGFLYPGFRDAHIHVIPYAALLTGCSLKSATSIDDLVARLATHARSLPPSEPVVATRMDDESLAERRLPMRSDLDRAVPGRPVVIYRYCGHVAVANTAALAASGIDRTTPDPDGGVIDRDESGTPTGVLRETAAGLIAPALARGGGLDPHAFLDGLGRLAGLGITSVGAMLGYGESPHEKLEAEVELLASVAEDLPIRVHAIVITDDPEVLGRTRDRLDSAGTRLRWLGVKRFADGSLGGHTAAMRAPFSDVDTSGTLRLTEVDARIARAAVAMGGMVAIHAIGDRAVDETLALFEMLVAEGASPDALRMEHVSVISPSQIGRFADAGVTASVQPAFLRSESEWVFDRVGAERTGWLYPFASMRRSGIPLAGSSDSPVEPPHPLWGMASAVGRHGIAPSERLTPLDALDLFTDGAARALREPSPLSPGSPADMVVLDTDITHSPPGGIEEARVIDTWVAGRIVDVDRTLPAWVD